MPNSALTNSTELLQIVEIFSPGFTPRCYQIIGKAVGVALELGEGHAPRAIGERDPVGKAPRRALEEIADRHPADAARPRHAAGCS